MKKVPGLGRWFSNSSLDCTTRLFTSAARTLRGFSMCDWRLDTPKNGNVRANTWYETGWRIVRSAYKRRLQRSRFLQNVIRSASRPPDLWSRKTCDRSFSGGDFSDFANSAAFVRSDCRVIQSVLTRFRFAKEGDARDYTVYAHAQLFLQKSVYCKISNVQASRSLEQKKL